jgi:hypothetical protein
MLPDNLTPAFNRSLNLREMEMDEVAEHYLGPTIQTLSLFACAFHSDFG